MCGVEACVWTKQSNSPDAGKLIRKAVEDGASVNEHDATSYMWTVLSPCRGACVRVCTRRCRIKGDIPYPVSRYRIQVSRYHTGISCRETVYRYLQACSSLPSRLSSRFRMRQHVAHTTHKIRNDSRCTWLQQMQALIPSSSSSALVPISPPAAYSGTPPFMLPSFTNIKTSLRSPCVVPVLCVCV